MEFDKFVLEGKKYQDLVKLAKERDVYRRYAPKAELIERLLDLNDKPPNTGESNLLSDVSMPSLNITDDESANLSDGASKSKNDKANKSGTASKKPVLSEINQENSPIVRRKRKTVAFITPEKRSSPAKRFTRVSTPAKPVKTPIRKSSRKSSIATSTPAAKVAWKTEENENPLKELDSTFTIEEEPVTSKSPQENSPVRLKREGTFEIITVNNGKRVSEVVGANGDPVSPWKGNWSKCTRSSRSSVSSLMSEMESKTPENLSVKELIKVFEPEDGTSVKETPTNVTRSWRLSNVSPQIKAKSTRSSLLRASLRKSDAKARANISLPSSVRQAFVTNRAKPTGYVKPPSTTNLSILKSPKLKSPSVAKEIELKQRAVSAKKMMEATSATKSKIPPPRKVPNFNEMHAKMFSKMESLVDDKQKVLVRAQEYGSSAVPRCAVATPKFFSAEKNQKVVKEERFGAARPVAARQLKMPDKSKIPGRLVSTVVDAVDSAPPTGVVPRPLNRKSATSSRNGETLNPVEKSKQSPRKFMPANRLISRLPVLVSSQPTRRSGNLFDVSNKGPSQLQRMKETIVTKAPAIRAQDIKNKNRKILQNVRTNKRFELQMQHRMKSQA